MLKALGLFRGARSLASQWQVLAGMAITMARHVLRLETARPKEALAKADMLEAWLACALTEVTHQIDAEPRDVHLARPFRDQLPPVAYILLCLLKVIQKVTARLRALLSKRAAFAIPASTAPGRRSNSIPTNTTAPANAAVA